MFFHQFDRDETTLDSRYWRFDDIRITGIGGEITIDGVRVANYVRE